jgi:hypothetical protein
MNTLVFQLSPNLCEEDQNLFRRPAKDIREKSESDCLQSLRLDNVVPGTDLFLHIPLPGWEVFSKTKWEKRLNKSQTYIMFVLRPHAYWDNQHLLLYIFKPGLLNPSFQMSPWFPISAYSIWCLIQKLMIFEDMAVRREWIINWMEGKVPIFEFTPATRF